MPVTEKVASIFTAVLLVNHFTKTFFFFFFNVGGKCGFKTGAAEGTKFTLTFRDLLFTQQQVTDLSFKFSHLQSTVIGYMLLTQFIQFSLGLTHALPYRPLSAGLLSANSGSYP